MLGKHLKHSLEDLKETLRRLFTEPRSQRLDLEAGPVNLQEMPPLTATPREVGRAFQIQVQTAALTLNAVSQPSPAFTGRLCEEKGWDAWQVQQQSLSVPLFSPAHRHPFEMPTLPRKAILKHAMPEAWRIRTQKPALGRLEGRSLNLPRLDYKVPKVLTALDTLFERPFQLIGIPFQRLPKPLQMRYSLQLVKSTQHNIRSMDILGLFHLPKEGVNAMRFDYSKKKLSLALTPSSARARRVPFLLVRIKESGEILSCYPEETP